jgi:glutathione S-transferase
MSDRIKLYGSSDSGNATKPRWVCEYLGIPFEWIETNAFNGETRTAEFLKLNPAGQVPTVVLKDGRTLAQSNAIMLHLAEGSALIPRDAYDRAKMFEWLFWEQNSHEIFVAVRIARLHYLKQREEELDPALKTRGNAALARMEKQLTETPYLVGETLTLADIALLAYTRKAELGGFDLASYPSVQTWIARMESELGLPPILSPAS